MAVRRRVCVTVAAIFGCAFVGCGKSRLKFIKTDERCPWSAAGVRARVGKRTVGQTYYGPISAEYWVDQFENEHQCEKIQKQVWALMEKYNVAVSVPPGTQKVPCAYWATVVAIDPLVVLLQPCQHKHFVDANGRPLSKNDHVIPHGTHCTMEVRSGVEVFFDPATQWFSPDLKRGPTAIEFSEQGTGEIPLPKGKLRLVRDGEKCKILRE